MLIYLVVNKQNNLSFKEDAMKHLLLAATVFCVMESQVLAQSTPPSFVNAAMEKASTEEEKMQNAILWINHISLVVTKILTYNDKLVLSLEYEKLIDSINYNNLPAGDLQKSIKELMDTLKHLNDSWDKREMYRDDYQKESDKAFFKACITVGKESLLTLKSVGTGDVRGFVEHGTAAGGKALEYLEVQEQLQKNLNDKERFLDEEDNKKIYALRSKIWESFQKEISETALKDQQRISVEDCRELLLILKQTTLSEQFYVLSGENNKRRFQEFPIYWYYLAVAANSVGKYDEALKALTHFKHCYRCLIRNDEFAVNTLVLESQILMGKKENIPQILHNLANIERMILDKDWKARYFAAVSYYALGKKEKAENLLKHNIYFLKALQKENSANKTRNFWGDANKPLVKVTSSDIPIGDNLALNRTFLFNMHRKDLPYIKNFIDKIGTDIAVSAYEKMQYQGVFDNDKIFASLEKDFIGVKGCLVNRRIKPFVKVVVPKTWFYTAQPPAFHLSFSGGDRKVLGENSYVPKSADYARKLSAFVIKFPFDKSVTPFEKIEMASLLIEGEFISATLHFKVLKNKEAELGQNEPAGKWDKLKKWSKKTLETEKRIWNDGGLEYVALGVVLGGPVVGEALVFRHEFADFKLVSVTFGGKTYNITEESK